MGCRLVGNVEGGEGITEGIECIRLTMRMREVMSEDGERRRERGNHTPQVGIAEAAGAQAVWAITEVKKRVKEARMIEVFILSVV
jgi:hypothetical protein